MQIKDVIAQGRAILGIEFGSTRIKATLIEGEHSKVIATGQFSWENKFEDGIWTYHHDEILKGLKNCYKDLKHNVKEQYGVVIENLAAIGISGMMHGYLAFDKDDRLLTPFRTWRNTNARLASEELTQKFDYNIPERWSVSHLYESILNKREHVNKLAFFTTLSGYIHYLLTGQKVLGIGDAVGMFTIDDKTHDYTKKHIEIFNKLAQEHGFNLDIKELLPKVLVAGDKAGELTEKGAYLLDEEGDLKAGIPLCPPEGDAGTGMVATNSVRVRTGNVSAGTSIFAMIVLEKALSKLYREIDNVTTPSGHAVAMVHANNCTSDINAWVGIFADFLKSAKIEMSQDALYKLLFEEALNGDKDCSGILSYNYLSGEFITNLEEGRPLLVRSPNAKFTLANLMRSNLYTSLGAIALGMKILTDKEQVVIDKIVGHGGLFRTKEVGQKIMANALNAPVMTLSTAGEGGPWGMAILANYMVNKEANESLEDFLEKKVFKDDDALLIKPEKEDVEGFKTYLDRYINCLELEAVASKTLV